MKKADLKLYEGLPKALAQEFAKQERKGIKRWLKKALKAFKRPH